MGDYTYTTKFKDLTSPLLWFNVSPRVMLAFWQSIPSLFQEIFIRYVEDLSRLKLRVIKRDLRPIRFGGNAGNKRKG